MSCSNIRSLWIANMNKLIIDTIIQEYRITTKAKSRRKRVLTKDHTTSLSIDRFILKQDLKKRLSFETLYLSKCFLLVPDISKTIRFLKSRRTYLYIVNGLESCKYIYFISTILMTLFRTCRGHYNMNIYLKTCQKAAVWHMKQCVFLWCNVTLMFHVKVNIVAC